MSLVTVDISTLRELCANSRITCANGMSGRLTDSQVEMYRHLAYSYLDRFVWNTSITGCYEGYKYAIVWLVDYYSERHDLRGEAFKGEHLMPGGYSLEFIDKECPISVIGIIKTYAEGIPTGINKAQLTREDRSTI